MEGELIDRATRLGQIIHSGPAFQAVATEELISGRTVWNLRDHIGQLRRELAHLDSPFLAAFFGHVAFPALPPA